MPRSRLLPALLLTCSGIALAAPPVSMPAPAPATSATPATASSTEMPVAASSLAAGVPDLADIRTFTRVYSMVKQAYVDKVDDKTLMRAAIRGHAFRTGSA